MLSEYLEGENLADEEVLEEVAPQSAAYVAREEVEEVQFIEPNNDSAIADVAEGASFNDTNRTQTNTLSVSINTEYYQGSVAKHQSYSQIQLGHDITQPVILYPIISVVSFVIGISLLVLLRKFAKKHKTTNPMTISSVIFLAPIFFLLLLKLTMNDGVAMLISIVSFIVGIILSIYGTSKVGVKNVRLIVRVKGTKKQVVPCHSID